MVYRSFDWERFYSGSAIQVRIDRYQYGIRYEPIVHDVNQFVMSMVGEKFLVDEIQLDKRVMIDEEYHSQQHNDKNRNQIFQWMRKQDHDDREEAKDFCHPLSNKQLD
jgi:hypothetical protein